MVSLVPRLSGIGAQASQGLYGMAMQKCQMEEILLGIPLSNKFVRRVTAW